MLYKKVIEYKIYVYILINVTSICVTILQFSENQKTDLESVTKPLSKHKFQL